MRLGYAFANSLCDLQAFRSPFTIFAQNILLAMKTLYSRFSLCLRGVVLIAMVWACSASAVAQTDGKAVPEPVDFVNPLIGTGGHGHTYPAVVVPHGMIQPGPDTRRNGWDACSGYHYSDSTINGFAHTRLSGTGCADFGDFLLMPTVGRQCTGSRADHPSPDVMPYASAFTHEDERAEPGYYAVRLQRYDVLAELTATPRAAIHRYTFPASHQAGFILDADYGIQDQRLKDVQVEVVNATTVRAYRRSLWWAYDRELFFVAEFSKPFSYTLRRDTAMRNGRPYVRCKLLLQFATAEGEQVMVRTAVSSVDHEGALGNLRAELPHWDFDRVRREARAAWNDVLSSVSVRPVDTGTAEFSPNDLCTQFYTALYHAHIAPSLFSDADGRYRGMDLQVHRGNPSDPNYTIFSLWDTFRALHPLYSILAPEQNAAYLRNLLRKGEEGGLVPKWDCAANYTGCMVGYHFASLCADALAKGNTDFDVAAAYRACVKLSQADTTDVAACVPRYRVRDVVPDERRMRWRYGYIPCDSANESVAKALEYAYDDWCIARLAAAAGDTAGRRIYDEMAQSYRAYYDSKTGFMRGRTAKGEWRTPFDPFRSEHRADDYCEGNAWQWLWFVPHDIGGLIDLMGGERKFVKRLDELFSASSRLTGDLVSSDISGLIGQYAHGNEPCHHVAHLYTYAGAPHRTQEVVDEILLTLYRNAPDGLCGNEDCGQMSAWYLLNAMGFYQVCPGIPVYSIGRPLFAECTLRLPEGRTFTIRTEDNSRKNKYVKSATLNGKRLKHLFFTHEELMRGGVLELKMGRRP